MAASSKRQKSDNDALDRATSFNVFESDARAQTYRNGGGGSASRFFEAHQASIERPWAFPSRFQSIRVSVDQTHQLFLTGNPATDMQWTPGSRRILQYPPTAAAPVYYIASAVTTIRLLGFPNELVNIPLLLTIDAACLRIAHKNPEETTTFTTGEQAIASAPVVVANIQFRNIASTQAVGVVSNLAGENAAPLGIQQNLLRQKPTWGGGSGDASFLLTDTSNVKATNPYTLGGPPVAFQTANYVTMLTLANPISLGVIRLSRTEFDIELSLLTAAAETSVNSADLTFLSQHPDWAPLWNSAGTAFANDLITNVRQLELVMHVEPFAPGYPLQLQS